MQTYSQTFLTASTWQLNVPGKYFTTLVCSQPINVRLYKGGQKLDLGDITGLLAGLEIGPLADLQGPMAFDRVEIDVQAGDTVQVGIGNGMARYNRAATSATITQNKVAISAAFSNTQKTVTTSSGQLAAQNSSRQYLLIQNNDAAANIFVTVGVAATFLNGIKITPGGSYELANIVTTQAINAISDIAGISTIVIVEG
jgi:hypothetical protein